VVSRLNVLIVVVSVDVGKWLVGCLVEATLKGFVPEQVECVFTFRRDLGDKLCDGTGIILALLFLSFLIHHSYFGSCCCLLRHYLYNYL
jgi:hypothetical protein